MYLWIYIEFFIIVNEKIMAVKVQFYIAKFSLGNHPKAIGMEKRF